ncbi:MAG TPA: hypothetical protein VE842_01205 [Pyrinomonadaceae bacterium]|jgi:hypothetical protein|nr:hypothetical protein [Pyrinomonadaceae bacterium]
MTKMNRARVVAFVCLLLLLVASGVAVGQRRRAAPAAARGDYFPLRVGDSWTYRHITEPAQFTIKVLGEEKQPDGNVQYLVELSSGTEVHYSYTKPSGWVLLRKVVYPKEEGLKIDYQPGKQYLMNPLVAGAKWRWSGKDVAGNDVAESNEVVGLEWVEVPAGRFRAMKMVSQVSSGGAAATKTYWYADGVGLIKSTTEAAQVRYGFELADYSFKKAPGR